jgi:hypothetical protein
MYVHVHMDKIVRSTTATSNCPESPLRPSKRPSSPASERAQSGVLCSCRAACQTRVRAVKGNQDANGRQLRCSRVQTSFGRGVGGLGWSLCELKSICLPVRPVYGARKVRSGMGQLIDGGRPMLPLPLDGGWALKTLHAPWVVSISAHKSQVPDTRGGFWMEQSMRAVLSGTTPIHCHRHRAALPLPIPHPLP